MSQPPSGGCVLKPCGNAAVAGGGQPAAFGRLCVETNRAVVTEYIVKAQPPSGGCVLKPNNGIAGRFFNAPAAFGRLCVETGGAIAARSRVQPSRLRAAVC